MKRIPVGIKIVKLNGQRFIKIPIHYKVLSKEKKLLMILKDHKIETDFESINDDLEKTIEKIRKENYGNSRVLIETTFIPIEQVELEIM